MAVRIISGCTSGVYVADFGLLPVIGNDVYYLTFAGDNSPGCFTVGNVTSSGATLTITPDNTAGSASSTPTLCINTALTAITHTTTGATGIGTATGLPAGVTAVEGTFDAGETVDLVGADGKVIARGIVNFDSDEIPQMLGRSTKELATTLGAEFERELVHRDDLVILN